MGLDFACCSCSCFFLAATRLDAVEAVDVDAADGAAGGVETCCCRFKAFLFVLLLLSSVANDSWETFLSTGGAIVDFSASGAFLTALAAETEVFDVFEATLVVADDGFRDVSTLVAGDDGLRDVSVGFVSDLGSAFKAVLALATMPVLCVFT